MDAALVQKNAIKTAVGVAIAYALALALGWQNPVWAAFAVYIPRLPYFGMTLHKSLLRMAGTIPGAIVAVVIVGTVAENHWLALAGISLATGFWFFLTRRSSDSYAFMVAGFTGYIVWSGVIFAPQNAFDVTWNRISETCLGIAVGAVVGGLMWPRLEAPVIADQLEALRTQLSSWMHTLADATDGDADAVTALPGSDAKIRGLLYSLESLFISVNRNTFSDSEIASQSRVFTSARDVVGHLGALKGLLRHYPQLARTGSASAVAGWLRECAAALEQMTWRDTGHDPVTPDLSESVSRFQSQLSQTVMRAMADEASDPQLLMLAVAAREQLEGVTAGLVTLSGRATESDHTSPGTTRIEGTSTPPESISFDVTRSLVTALAMFAAGAFWYSVYIPAGSAAFQFAGAIQIVLITAPIFPYRMFFSALLLGTAGTLPLVFLVMPQLDGVFQLAMMIFIVTLFLAILQELPRGRLYGLLGFLTFTGLIMVQEQQGNYATMLPAFYNAAIAQIVGAHISLAVAVLLIPTSPGQQLVRSMRKVLSLAGQSCSGDGSAEKPGSNLMDTLRRRRALMTACDQVAGWSRRLAGYLDKDDLQAMNAAETELRRTAEALSALHTVRVNAWPELSEHGRHVDSELSDKLAVCLNAFGSEPGTADQKLTSLRLATNEAATNAFSLAREGDSAGASAAMSLAGHYLATTASCASLAVSLQKCNFERLSGNRF